MADKYNEHTDSIALEDVRFLFPYDNILYASFLSHTTWLASFDTDDVDVVLRSSDNVDFLAHKTILSVASPIFKMVFRMPQPVVYEDGAIHPETGLPLVPLEEDHRTLDILLRMCYPCHRMTPLLLDDIRPILRAAHKFELEQIITQIRGILTMFMPAEPLRVFAIACNMGWEGRREWRRGWFRMQSQRTSRVADE
ncbi:hypothetical protein A0H81_11054 [Grifola frondosa]|uniref:BTB domain-containing protein n=1 Tax=Grifola frondosa TaxID=5627 RepID=A0A1C7LVH8_GRIFR|nr:hypothetical protein A0H81_11054 [Grifola frondosa]